VKGRIVSMASVKAVVPTGFQGRARLAFMSASPTPDESREAEDLVGAALHDA